ncbi:MAG: ATP synthase F0 subunit C [Myxococcales bacterium]|nr:MAG: ATP synthase F0 subunit C [Myxococcales bacterium]
MIKFFITAIPVFFAAGSALAGNGSDSSSHLAGYAIAASIAIALPAMGGAIGQGRAAAAALEGIARNPGASGKIFVPMILGMALIESLVLFGLIMAFILSGKIG